jgi:hypothetical protein
MKALTKAAGSRLAKSYTIEPEVNTYVLATKGDASASERVNELLKRAIAQERYEHLEQEAAAFFAAEADHRTGTSAFQKAQRRVLERD